MSTSIAHFANSAVYWPSTMNFTKRACKSQMRNAQYEPYINEIAIRRREERHPPSLVGYPARQAASHCIQMIREHSGRRPRKTREAPRSPIRSTVFAIGDRDSLKFNTGGSLYLYIQRDKPGADKESNWLPAPKSGVLGLTMRLYAANPQVADGRWNAPPRKKVN